MISLAASLILCLAFSVTVTSQTTCQNWMHCPCGNTERNVTVCKETEADNSCTRWSNCKTCQDELKHCLECPDGLEGPLCTVETKQKKSRQKRQYYVRPQRPGNRPAHGNYQRNPGHQNSYPTNPAAQNGLSYCSNLDSPKLGSIRCFTVDQERTCVARCLPGYNFENHESDEELTLVCHGGVWVPMDSFPDCKSGGHCDLVVQGAGSFNCTTGMRGTRCDVRCNNRYAGQYYCYPGLRWDPPLPRCVRPKEVTEGRHSCRCEYGASCDNNGKCVCPAGRTGSYCETKVIECHCEHGASCDSNGRCVCPIGRTGLYCETVLPQVKTCPDPGFISNGLRKETDGSESIYRQSFTEGQSVVFSCSSEEFALQGSSLLTCKKDGTWSNTLPKCIKPAAAPAVTCRDPGQVANAERLNSDGSPSVGVQTYKVGQSVVYTCYPGFALERRSLITCLASGAWSSRAPYCTRITPASPVVRTTTAKPDTSLKFCRDPGVDPNGSRQPRSPSNRKGFPQGTRLEYSCNQGYTLSGERSLFCLISGEWSALRPTCGAEARNPDTDIESELAYCLNPGSSISNGEIVYYPNINNRRHGTPEPGSLDEPEYPEGSRLEYSCRSGYTLEGSASLKCEKTGFWSHDPPVCRRASNRLRYCKSPGSIPNGKVVHLPSMNGRRSRPPASDSDVEQYPQGSRLQYSCDSGYNLEGATTLTCESAGRWSASLPRCVRTLDSTSLTYCKNPGSISNGVVAHLPALMERRPRPPESDDEMDEYPQGSRLQYTCDTGFTMEGARTLTCEESGRWSASLPRCTRTVVSSRDMLLCTNPGPVTNGRVKYFSAPTTSRRSPPVDEDLDDYPEGTRLEYSCDDGYQVQGSSTLTCQSTGFWSADPPTCVGECGRSFMQTNRRILHGEKTVSGEWPWVVAISVQENDDTRLICGGAVVNSQTVITAAHCLFEASTFVLRFGKLSRRIQDDDAEVLVRRSTRIIIHPDFTNSTLDSDIGLVIFQPRIRYSVRVQPICLPTAETTARNLMTGKKGYLSGWGITERNLPAGELLKAALPVINNEACIESYRRQNITLPITRNMFCAGYENAQQSACSGDSGSPLVFYDNNAEKYTLEGIVSFGVEGQCGLPGRYTIFTKVFRFLPWILRNT